MAHAMVVFESSLMWMHLGVVRQFDITGNYEYNMSVIVGDILETPMRTTAYL